MCSFPITKYKRRIEREKKKKEEKGKEEILVFGVNGRVNPQVEKKEKKKKERGKYGQELYV